MIHLNNFCGHLSQNYLVREVHAKNEYSMIAVLYYIIRKRNWVPLLSFSRVLIFVETKIIIQHIDLPYFSSTPQEVSERSNSMFLYF